MTELMSPQEVAASWSAIEQAASYSVFRPFSESAMRFISEAQSDRHVFTGIPPLDAEMRGMLPGHLTMVVGYSHSGKTLTSLHMLRHNRTKRVAWFSPDEPGPLLLCKLASATWGLPAAQLEQRVASEDPAAIRVLHQTVEEFPNLAVFDRPLSPRVMRQGYDEACDHWGAPADLVVVDYLDLMQAGEHLGSKADFIKGFGMEREVPMWVLHQTSRSAGANGRRMKIDSGNFGGETWATYQIGVWRKKFAIEAEMETATGEKWEQLAYDLRRHQYTITVNLNKNKRPGGNTVGEVDFEVDLQTGCLTELRGDLPRQMRTALRVVGGSDPYSRYENGEDPW